MGCNTCGLEISNTQMMIIFTHSGLGSHNWWTGLFCGGGEHMRLEVRGMGIHDKKYGGKILKIIPLYHAFFECCLYALHE